MEFDFLPNLPKSDLDDRQFQDLVDECILRIPRYCPEWTNYNPSDPGITLIELFAWLTDQMLLRFNQVPRRHYVAFLELLGVRLQAPNPAKTDITFYLSASLPESYTIPAGTQVATVRTETEGAIVFSTDRPLVMGTPSIRHLLGARTAETVPQVLRDRFVGTWTLRPDGEWEGQSLSLFEEQPEIGNCFYLVFDPDAPLEGNTIALCVKGEAATSTGIDPERPPRRWEAWNGLYWESILREENDDLTEGFSFSELTRKGGNPLSGADVILHLPKHWPVTHFVTYAGRWLRCVYTLPDGDRPGYIRSPRIVGLSTRSIGGTVEATQCSLVENEILGESNGQPGQTFQLQGTPVLPRDDRERILVTPPNGIPQLWEEVSDFSNSGAEDLHYTIDSLDGTVQFGPLIRSSGSLPSQTDFRRSLQGMPNQRPDGRHRGTQNNSANDRRAQFLERQYGAVPPRGSLIQMAAYRTGGGEGGNVQENTIRIVKTAVPYVASATNHRPARHGSNAETLEEAAMRVPRMLRTRDRAVTVEDFESLAIKAGQGAIARAMCLSPRNGEQGGIVRLVLVPHTSTDGIERGEGIDPERLLLTPELQQQVLDYLDERRLLGVQVLCTQPEYVGVGVQTEVALEAEYKHPSAQQQILAEVQQALYRFLNPLTGGPEGTGWPFGRPLYSSDIVTLLQKITGVRYLGTVQLFELRHGDRGWVRSLPREPQIDPGPLGLICSWRNDRLRSGHAVGVI